MKSFKKMMALVIAMAMVLAMSMTVFAAPDTLPTAGTITVNNAARGETYKAFKILNAEVGANGAIVYKGDIPAALASVFTKNDAGEISVADGVTDTALFEALKAYVDGLEEGSEEASIDATSETVVFENLAFGYYVITSTQGGGAAISVTSTDPDGVVNEKNVTTPEPQKTVDDDAYSIGDTITYTVTFNGANYRGSDTTAKIVTSYDVKDTLPAFLSNAHVSSVTIGEGDDATVLDDVDFNAQKTFNIPWAHWNETDEKWESLYSNGTLVTIVYTATLTDVVRVGESNTNTITISPNVGTSTGEEEPTEESWSDDAEVTTYAAAIKKTDGSKELAGAKFRIPGLKATKGDDGVYTVTSYDPAVAATIESLDDLTDENSTELEVDANGMIYIVGIEDALTLKVYETVAPTGYNRLEDPEDLTTQVLSSEIFKKDGYRKYDAKGNIIEEVETETATYTKVTKNLSDLNATALNVINNKGTTLPSTGGIGTTIFYVIGAILVLGAGVLLVTRRRMNAN